MILKENKCIFCGENDNIETIPAKMSPFIKARIETNDDKYFYLVHCKNCGSAFYNYRYDDKEIEKIYNNYRNKEYQTLRQKYESWYSKDINKLLGDDIATIRFRNKYMQRILTENISIGDIKNVLDYGGDKGQNIPTCLNKVKKYVYDISSNKAVEGVTQLNDIKECKNVCPNGFDFIMCTHVLEHVSDPDTVVKDMEELLKENGFLYIEVPFDSPFYKHFMDNIQFIFNKYFKLKDIIKKFIEIKTSKYAIMHEHINFFTIKGLNNLISKNNLNIIYSEVKSFQSAIGVSKVICLIATKD